MSKGVAVAVWVVLGGGAACEGAAITPRDADVGTEAAADAGTDAATDADADAATEAAVLDAGPALCVMDERRPCGPEDVVYGGRSRCVRGTEICRGGCTDVCPFARDGTCDDGRPGANSACVYGTDCTDCMPAAVEWSGCIDLIGPIAEQCDNGIDDDCDGTTDEGCS